MTDEITDETIEAGLALSGVIPDMVEWWGNPKHAVTVRVEPHMGRYAQGTLRPYMTPIDVSDVLERLSREVDE